VGITDLCSLLKNIHPGFSIPLGRYMGSATTHMINPTFLQNAKAQDKKKGEGQDQ
jgi:hypothetical protein